jgi:hypothetical protein
VHDEFMDLQRSEQGIEIDFVADLMVGSRAASVSSVLITRPRIKWRVTRGERKIARLQNMVHCS